MSRLKKAPKKMAMMSIWENLDEEQENAESQGEEEIIVNLCFMANIISEEKIKASNSEVELKSENLQKAYDDLLDDS